jgi:hypothetical protein
MLRGAAGEQPLAALHRALSDGPAMVYHTGQLVYRPTQNRSLNPALRERAPDTRGTPFADSLEARNHDAGDPRLSPSSFVPSAGRASRVDHRPRRLGCNSAAPRNSVRRWTALSTPFVTNLRRSDDQRDYFFFVRVAPPRPRNVTPDSESTRCTKP